MLFSSWSFLNRWPWRSCRRGDDDLFWSCDNLYHGCENTVGLVFIADWIPQSIHVRHICICLDIGIYIRNYYNKNKAILKPSIWIVSRLIRNSLSNFDIILIKIEYNLLVLGNQYFLQKHCYIQTVVLSILLLMSLLFPYQLFYLPSYLDFCLLSQKRALKWKYDLFRWKHPGSNSTGTEWFKFKI